MWPLGRSAGAVGVNSGEARRSVAGEVREEGLEVTRVRFVALLGARISHPVLKAKPNALITCAPGSSYTHA
jgi:hypothetical protein